LDSEIIVCFNGDDNKLIAKKCSSGIKVCSAKAKNILNLAICSCCSLGGIKRVLDEV